MRYEIETNSYLLHFRLKNFPWDPFEKGVEWLSMLLQIGICWLRNWGNNPPRKYDEENRLILEAFSIVLSCIFGSSVPKSVYLVKMSCDVSEMLQQVEKSLFFSNLGWWNPTGSYDESWLGITNKRYYLQYSAFSANQDCHARRKAGNTCIKMLLSIRNCWLGCFFDVIWVAVMAKSSLNIREN